MQDPDPVAQVRRAELDPEILGETARRLFGLS
jgi:hypothetical protein